MRKKALRFMVLFGVAAIVMGLVAAAPALAVKPVEFEGLRATNKVILDYADASFYSTGQRSIAATTDDIPFFEVYAVWITDDKDVKISRQVFNEDGSLFGGPFWRPSVKVDTLPGSWGSNKGVIAIDPVTWDVHVVYEYRDGAMRKIRHVMGYEDSWDQATDVNGTIPGSYGTTVAAYGGTAHVVWQAAGATDGEIYHAVSSDGQTWNISDTGFFGREPNIIADADGNLYMSWGDGGTKEIFLSKSLYDPGTSTWGNWSPPSIAHDGSSGIDFLSMAVQNSSNIYIAWRTLVNGVPSIVCVYTSDGGDTWSQIPSTVDSHNDTSGFVSVAASPTGEVSVAWGRGTGSGIENSGIYVSRSTDGGQTWQPSTQVPESQEGKMPHLAVAPNGKMHIMWESLYSDFGTPRTLATFTREQ